MTKLRSDSTWSQLTTQQWETLEGWLFDENISYREAVGRVEKEWGLKSTPSSLVRFYKFCAKNRAVDGMPEAMETARQVNQSEANVDELRSSSMKVLSRKFFEQSMEARNFRELTALGHIIDKTEAREIR